MAKPIVLIRVPVETQVPSDQVERLVKMMSDYYVLFMKCSSVSRLEIETFYDSNMTQINYEELKSIVEKSLKDTTNESHKTE